MSDEAANEAMKQEANEALNLLDDDLDQISTALTQDNTPRGAAVAAARTLIALTRLGSRIFRTINDHFDD